MIRLGRITRFAAIFGALFVCARSVHAMDIGGTISSTLTITEDSQLVDDVTCTVTSAPCIAINAPHVTLELNGFTMTGQAHPHIACNGGIQSGEAGVGVVAQTDVAIHGPGLIQQFRYAGIYISNSTSVRVSGVTMSTNCASGILVGGGSDHDLRGNIAIRNGNGASPCGGI